MHVNVWAHVYSEARAVLGALLLPNLLPWDDEQKRAIWGRLANQWTVHPANAGMQVYMATPGFLYGHLGFNSGLYAYRIMFLI